MIEVEAGCVADLVDSSALGKLNLPFPSKTAAWRLVSGHGRCIQGVNGASTHRGTLAYSFDFKLAIGTPVMAVRAGWVAAAVSHFAGGGARAHLAPRANFVALKHDDGSYSRYYHLKSAKLAVGDRVERGQVIGYSGNTGYTGGPHLHFDVVDVLPEETSVLTVGDQDVPCIAAAFSCELGHVKARLRYLPNDVEWRRDDDEDFVALADREPGKTFAERIASLAQVGAKAAIVANNRAGPELFAMGGCEEPSAVPAVLVSKESGTWLKKLLAKGKVHVDLVAHNAVRRARPLADQMKGLATVPFSCVYGPKLRYVTRTVPVQFVCSAKRNSFVPVQNRYYPPIVPARLAPPCACCGGGRAAALDPDHAPKDPPSSPPRRLEDDDQ